MTEPNNKQQKPSIHNTCAVILCGGRGNRMGGLDKGLMPWKKRHLIQYAIDALTPQLEYISINCNRHADQYQQFNYPLIEDETVDFAGPLAGILSAIKNTQHKYVLITPCDCPTIPADLFIRLAKALQDSSHKIAIAHDGKRSQPLFGLYHCDLQSPLEAFLGADKHKVHEFINQVGHIEVDFSDQGKAFLNFNSPEDMT